MLNTLQLGRALAAIFVAAFHLSISMSLSRNGGIGVFSEYTKYGKLGVDFFFVLSGFIILFAHKSDLGHPEKWPRYIYRRFIRVYPIYWIYTLLFVASLAIVGGTDAQIPKNFSDWLTTITLIRFTDASPPLAPAWTLFHEIAFYLIFSVLLLNRKLGIILLSVWTIISIALYHYPAEDARNFFNVYTSAYSLFFLCGMGAYWIYQRSGKGIAEAVCGAAVLLFAFFTIESNLSKIAIAIGFALLLGGLAKMELRNIISVPMSIAAIGDASYTIYLIHLAIEGILLKFVMKIGFYRILGPHISYIAVLAGTILGGYLAYRFIERPLIEKMKLIKFNQDNSNNKLTMSQ